MKNVNSSKDNVLAILKEDEEVSEESDSKRREYSTKIQQLEKSVGLMPIIVIEMVRQDTGRNKKR